MKRAFPLLTIILIIGVTLAGCNLPLGGGAQAESIEQTAIALGVAQTQFAASQTAAAVTPTLAATATADIPTPEPYTPTPTLTLAPQYTPTRGGVWLTVKQATNCRSGPGSVFEFRGLINEGLQVEAVGRSTINEYFYIKNPTPNSEFCWLWSRYSTISGDTSILPIFTPQPTPTPKITLTPTKAPADISAKYLNTQTCSSQYGIQLYLVNTGSTTWESIRVTLVDNTTATSTTHTNNYFFGTDGCAVDTANKQSDLTPGEYSRVALVNPGELNYNPSGHSFTATITMFSADGNTGTSFTKTINFTP